MQFSTNSESASKFFFFVERKEALKTKLGLIQYFTASTRPVLTSIPKDIATKDIIKVTCSSEEFKLFMESPTLFIPKNKVEANDFDKLEPAQNFQIYGVIPTGDNVILIKLSEDGSNAPFHPFEQFHITSEMIANYTQQTPLLTDIGKFTVNYLLFADTVGNLVPYQNKKLSPGKTDSLIATLLLEGKIGRAEYLKYIDQGFWFLENGTLFVGAFTERSLTTGDDVLRRKQELLKQYKDQLSDPDIIARIETELINLDKAYIKGDASEIFFEACGKKSYNEARKKMYLLFGMSNTFADPHKKFEFTPNSLEEGWEPKYLATGANEVRRGSYGRGIETAKGGAESKFILRTFQETRITEDDCGDIRGMEVQITEDNVDFYVDRYTVDNILITDENKASFIGKTIRIRSPMTCRCKDGFCFKCCGEVFKRIDLKAIGMQTLLATSTFTTHSMKSMHVSSIKTISFDDFDPYILGDNK